MKDKMFMKLSDFNNLPMDEQGQFTVKIVDILERLSSGVWVEKNSGTLAYMQCAFCCVGPHSEHEENCPVKLSREILEDE